MLCFVWLTLFTALLIQHRCNCAFVTERNSYQRPMFYKRHTVNTYHPLPLSHHYHQRQHYAPNLPPITTTAFRERRGVMSSSSNSNSDSSCYRSAVMQNVTLKGGIEAGYFRKLAEHVAMKLCVELCCEEKGCDVAFMWGKHCYGVQCFSQEQCEAVPAKQKLDEPLMLSRVTFHGHKLHPTKHKKPQCISTEVQPGVTLRAGLRSGNFTHLGTVTDMKTCVRFCCARKGCDLALVVDDECFAVSCYNPVLCEMTKAFSRTFKPNIAYVLKSDDKQNSTLLKEDSREDSLDERDKTHPKQLDQPGNNNHEDGENNESEENTLICKNSPVFFNTTLKGGYRAGNYTNLGRVADMSECVHLCCDNSNCNAALMLENNCFFVECKDADSCLPVRAKTTHTLAALNPRVSFITSRSKEAAISKQTEEGVCRAGAISYDVSLKGGSEAGNFTPHGKVHSMEECITKCCNSKGCNLAMMLKDICFTVVCKNEQSCEKKHTTLSSRFSPKVAYVFKKKKDYAKPDNPMLSQRKMSQSTSTFAHNSKSKVNLPNSANQMKGIQNRTNQIQALTTNSSNQNKKVKNRTNQFQPNTAINHLANHKLQNQNLTYHKTVQYKLSHTVPNMIPTTASPPAEQSAMSNNATFLLNFLQENRTENSTSDDIIDYAITKNNDVNKNNDVTEQDSVIRKPVPLQAGSTKRPSINNSDCLDEPCNSFYNGVNEEVDSRSKISKNLNTSSPTLNEAAGDSYGQARNSSVGNSQANTDSEASIHTLNTDNDEARDATLSNSSSSTSTPPGLLQVRVEQRRHEGDDPSCTYSEVLRNATLRGNLQSGKFSDRGEMEEIRQCVRLCCMLKGCDLAFMLQKKCFTVECENKHLCEPVPAKSAVYSPMISYVLKKNG